MASITQSIDVDVDVTTACKQWTQFETFPQFLSFVESIRQLDWEPEGVVENVGAAVGIDDHAIKKDLTKFKEFIESRGTLNARDSRGASPLRRE